MCCSAETRRLFFALDPNDAVRNAIVAVQREMNLPARRVVPENLHVTLAFLGEVDAGRIDELRTMAAGLSFPACRMQLDRNGCFPRTGVAWLGCSEPPEALTAFQALLNTRLAEAGFRSESKTWVPHLTLYRKMRKPCGRIPIEAVEWRIDGFSLMRSTPGPAGPVYTTLSRWQTAV